jgi:hypothetical protein
VTRLIPSVGLLAAFALASPAASAAPLDATLDSPAGASTVRFVSERAYVVSTTVGRREVSGRGRLPDGFTPSNVSARPASNALGSRAVEVLVDHGMPVYSASARGYSLFTHRRGRLRPVTLKGRPVALATYAEDSGQGGFRCKDGRLLLHWFDLGSNRGQQTTYRLAGSRLKQVSRKALRRSVASNPASCA